MVQARAPDARTHPLIRRSVVTGIFMRSDPGQLAGRVPGRDPAVCRWKGLRSRRERERASEREGEIGAPPGPWALTHVHVRKPTPDALCTIRIYDVCRLPPACASVLQGRVHTTVGCTTHKYTHTPGPVARGAGGARDRGRGEAHAAFAAGGAQRDGIHEYVLTYAR